MTISVETSLSEPLLLDFSTVKLTDEQFYLLCMQNPEKKLELTAAGVLVVMAPVGGESGKEEARLNARVFTWNEDTQLGEVFSSSTIFKLPNGSQRSPDVAWVKLDRWEALTVEQRKKFPPLAPDFAIELRSESDRLSDLQAKMREYQENGVRLGWLIDPQNRIVEIYRFGQEVEILESPESLSGEDVLPNFVLNLSSLW
ncbi:Uma2 family endonuclease [Tumidithrix elongata RA019]|uniref:Uma2 family endonuclease n=1 Tax=Tumidithrix elongata BACA0141 TaxID=2716417 RepID=A0AAW9Q1A8_9CYAN|nr:Uma2 family endonuclease [Tumidithrix elongata RA019]